MSKIIPSRIIIKELNLNTELNKILDELEQEVLQEIESDSKHEKTKNKLQTNNLNQSSNSLNGGDIIPLRKQKVTSSPVQRKAIARRQEVNEPLPGAPCTVLK